MTIDAVDRLAQVALAHLDELGLERVPERRGTAGGELAAEVAAEVTELVVADIAAELGLLAQRCLDRLQAQRQLERAHPGDPPVGVLLDLTLDRVHGRVDGPEHEHGQVLLLEPLGGQGGVRALDEVLGRLLTPLEVVRVRIGGVDLILQAGDPGVETVSLRVVDEAAAGDTDADQDPDDEHQEDRRERRDVVAEVEHP